jgi:toxin ParE1/3/4
MPRVRLDPDAEAELDEAAAYYEQEEPGLGRDFLFEFRAVLGKVEELFGIGALVLGLDEHEVRRFAFNRFPYKVLAVKREDEITIVAVSHNHRRPGYWSDRLEP